MTHSIAMNGLLTVANIEGLDPSNVCLFHFNQLILKIVAHSFPVSVD